MGSFEVDPTALEDAAYELSAAEAGLRDADEVLARLGESLLRVDLVVRTAHDSHPPILGLFTGPRS